MKKFNEWFEQNLIVGRFPMPTEIFRAKYDYVINVSDEYIPDCFTAANQSDTKYFWFPMNESCNDIGLNSIYAALQIIYIAEQSQKTVYLHCHAGINRSVTVADAYFYMRTGKHRLVKKENNVKVNFGVEPHEEEQLINNRLLNNINEGLLPAKRKMETFLKNCPEIFEKEVSMRGGGLDVIKFKSKMG